MSVCVCVCVFLYSEECQCLTCVLFAYGWLTWKNDPCVCWLLFLSLTHPHTHTHTHPDPSSVGALVTAIQWINRVNTWYSLYRSLCYHTFRYTGFDERIYALSLTHTPTHTHTHTHTHTVQKTALLCHIPPVCK